MKKSLALNVLAATALAGLFAMPAMTEAYAQEERTARSGASRAVVFCDGFAQELVKTNTQNAVATTTSGTFVTIPNTVVGGGGSGNVDLYTVTFSGEASASGGGSWDIVAQVSINGGAFVDMNPTGATRFHSGNDPQTHTMTWCRQISASNTSFRIQWRKNGGGAANVDNYVTRVERSN